MNRGNDRSWNDMCKEEKAYGSLYTFFLMMFILFLNETILLFKGPLFTEGDFPTFEAVSFFSIANSLLSQECTQNDTPAFDRRLDAKIIQK